MKKRTRNTTTFTGPSEADEQALLFEWMDYATVKYPELILAYHIPNEGRRSLRGGYELKRQGMRKGVPDICLPFSNGRYHAMYIEMKRLRDGRVSDEQRWWNKRLNEAGNKAVVCKGFDEARQAILDYLAGKD